MYRTPASCLHFALVSARSSKGIALKPTQSDEVLPLPKPLEVLATCECICGGFGCAIKRVGPKPRNSSSNPSHSCALPPQPYRKIVVPWYTAYYSGSAESRRSFYIHTRMSGGMPCYVVPNPSSFGRFAGIFVSALLTAVGKGKFILLASWLPPIPARSNRTIARTTHRPYNVTSIGLAIFDCPCQGTMENKL